MTGSSTLAILAIAIICLSAVLNLRTVDAASPSSSVPSSTSGTSSPDAVHPFVISVPDSLLESLQSRLALTTFPTAYATDNAEDGSDWSKGASIQYMKTILSYWHKPSDAADDVAHYDWRARESIINSAMPQFTTMIDTFNVHFVHARSSSSNAIPLLMIHGWPGSFLECSKVLPLLTRPSDASSQSFDLVCPSIPGYGFSSAPTEPGFSPAAAAAVFVKLMHRLYPGQDYVVQGGDWGSVIGSYVAMIDTQHCRGLHINMASILPPINLFKTRSTLYALYRSINTIIDMALPTWRFDPDDADIVQAPQSKLLDQTGYFHTQATFPDTLGIALHDSPIGLGAWLIEKYRLWSDNHGDIDSVFTRDEVLDHIMIYFVSGTITSSMRLYYEATHVGPRVSGQHRTLDSDKSTRVSGMTSDGMWSQMTTFDIKCPTAFASFPAEPLNAPAKWLREYYNLKQYTKMPRGGHFAALEQPTMIVDDIRLFVDTFIKPTWADRQHTTEAEKEL